MERERVEYWLRVQSETESTDRFGDTVFTYSTYMRGTFDFTLGQGCMFLYNKVEIDDASIEFYQGKQFIGRVRLIEFITGINVSRADAYGLLIE